MTHDQAAAIKAHIDTAMKALVEAAQATPPEGNGTPIVLLNKILSSLLKAQLSANEARQLCNRAINASVTRPSADPSA